MPKVSVIVANYNNERYLSECLDSMLKQTYQDFEVLVFDDASTDKSRQLISKFAEKDPRIRLIALPENKGVAHLRSVSLGYCKGEYVAILDADDYSEPDRLKREVEFLDSHSEVVLVGGIYAIVDETSRVLNLSQPLPTSDIELRWRMSTGNCFAHSTVMFRTGAALEAGGYDALMTCAEDMDLYTRIMQQGKLAFIPHLLSYWRTHAISYSGQASNKLLQGTYQVLANTAKLLVNANISLQEAKALYDLSAENKAEIVRVLHLIRAYRIFYSQTTSQPSERRLLLRLHLKMLIELKKRNHSNSWYHEAKAMLESQIKEILASKGYYWLWDKGLNLSARKWIYLLCLAIKPQFKD
ncbi:MAG: hypothetical protein CVU50_03330 [Candidatus Cloacimonetes bacterium HGW-Cloacimonetes-3]|jgi:glycosyltransferase involved in cell wall biosynthesis|nr:MAG: hypothetical protein CVU50_03330 [Candidatus Cloacimonetes bacterium HGW-Cloacimonetes-3]